MSFCEISKPAGRARNVKPVLMFSRVMLVTTFEATQARNAAIRISTTAWIAKARHARSPRGSAKRGRRGGGRLVAVIDLSVPLVPAKAGTQSQAKEELDSRLRGNERERARHLNGGAIISPPSFQSLFWPRERPSRVPSPRWRSKMSA